MPTRNSFVYCVTTSAFKWFIWKSMALFFKGANYKWLRWPYALKDEGACSLRDIGIIYSSLFTVILYYRTNGQVALVLREGAYTGFINNVMDKVGLKHFVLVLLGVREDAWEVRGNTESALHREKGSKWVEIKIKYGCKTVERTWKQLSALRDQEIHHN